jgi:hypothetical protein
MAKQRQSAAPAAVMHLAEPLWQAKCRVTLRVLLTAHSLVPRQLLLRAKSQPQDWPLRQALEIPRARVRAHRCLRGLVPSAFFPEIPAAQKYNRAVRCGDCPISARYRRRYNRRGLAGYGNRHSRLLHKRARPARTFPIVGADKCPSPLRRIQD